MSSLQKVTVEESSCDAEDVMGVTGLDETFGVLAAEVDDLGVVEVVQVVAGNHQQLAEAWRSIRILLRPIGHGFNSS